MQIQRYATSNPALRTIAAFIWHLTSAEAVTDSRLLPVINTDLVINISTPITYRFIGETDNQAPPVHIRYAKLKPQIINQAAEINVWGVSLYPFGVYPLLQANMSALEGSVINVEQINPEFSTTVVNGLKQIGENSRGPALIEDALMKWFANSTISIEEIKQMQGFIQHFHGQRIGEFCHNNGIGVKSLERLIKKYVGLSPKQLHQIGRFQKAGNDMIYSPEPPALADLAYTYEYCDQMHLTKDFKKQAGVTPLLFIHKHDTVKEKIKTHKGS